MFKFIRKLIAIASLTGMSFCNAEVLELQGDKGSEKHLMTVYSSPSKSAVIVDHQMVVQNVSEYADSGAVRFVATHAGPTYGYPVSSAPADIRASEHQVLRMNGTAGNTWGMEVGVHSEVLGNTLYKNVGIYVASSHTGWLTNPGVRNDTAVIVGGEDGWYHGFVYLDTNMNTLFDVNKLGNMYSRSSSVGGTGIGTTLLRTQTNATGAYIRAENDSASGARSLFFGTDYNVSTELTSAAFKPVTNLGIDLGETSKRFRGVYADTGSFSGPIKFKPAQTAVPASIGEVVFLAPNNSSIQIKIMCADGVIRTATLALQ